MRWTNGKIGPSAPLKLVVAKVERLAEVPQTRRRLCGLWVQSDLGQLSRRNRHQLAHSHTFALGDDDMLARGEPEQLRLTGTALGFGQNRGSLRLAVHLFHPKLHGPNMADPSTQAQKS